MRKLPLLVALLVNIIVLASSAEVTQTVQQTATASAAASSNSSSDGGSASAAATATATAVVKTTTTTDNDASNSSNAGGSASANATATATATTTTANNENSGSGSTGAGSNNCCYDKYNECSGEDFEIAKSKIATLGWKYFYELVTSYECDAELCSPLPPYIESSFIGLFTQNYSAAYNETLEFSGLENENKIRCVLRLINCLLLLDIPNGVYYSFSVKVVSYVDNPFSKPFECEAKRTLGGTAYNCDFENPERVQSTINNAIEDETDGNVVNTVPCSEPFTKTCTGDKLVFASGQVFESLWQIDFESAGKGNYTDMDNNTREVDGVMQCDTYNYVNSEELDAQVLQVDYKDAAFQITFIVPNNGVSMSVYTDLILKLQNSTIYSQTIMSFKKEPFRLLLPVYSNIQRTHDYVESLKQQDILTPLYAPGTSSIVNACTGKSSDEYVSSAYSKAFIKNGLRGVERNNCNDSNVKEFRIGKPAIFVLSREGVFVYIGFTNVE